MKGGGAAYSSLIGWPACAGWSETSDIVTPLAEAVATLMQRREDTQLRARVEDYLGGDIPDYFRGPPVLYLCRHVASPNLETLRFLTIARRRGFKTVIGQDPKDIFAPRNPLKRALGKLSICTRLARKGDRPVEQIRKLRIVDFNSAGGKPLHSLRTLWGEPLVDFHNALFDQFAEYPVQIEDDSHWVDRYHRGDLLAEYKSFLALLIVHGVMFEDYPIDVSSEEAWFVSDILRPAFTHVETTLGVRPLITPLVPCGVASFEVWTGYPPKVWDVVQSRMRP